ncbi:PIN domain-containing protein [Desulfosporosinus sp. BICA1-9]|uniref:PIN domain-containing protein n=1 Tax=Desulfosporosinus sp. BICA1-9 TaxID=1531958 RepID=UPI00054B560A|nr:PIN domain-containing protein [Desulfosporosinus sp. BICA1-9]KJS49581.1 MAG: twitching motility protein PilT [Peptococcaceae bacterium BRH_c23]KJS90044.1 MAG: twitching motility protein PilT [Desulfosporosinus sp. BICA1-9]
MARRLWLDTNVIIRIITGDPQEMAQEAEDMILKVEMGELVLRLSAIVVAECCWVLESFYEAQPTDISDTLLKFTNAIGVETEEKPVVQQALLDFSAKKVDFVDAYIAAHAKANPPEDVVTWDKHYNRLDISHDRPGN